MRSGSARRGAAVRLGRRQPPNPLHHGALASRPLDGVGQALFPPCLLGREALLPVLLVPPALAALLYFAVFNGGVAPRLAAGNVWFD